MLEVPVGVVVEPGLLALVPFEFVVEVPTPLPGVVAPDVPVLDVPVGVVVDGGLFTLVPFAFVFEVPVEPAFAPSENGTMLIGGWPAGALKPGVLPGRLAYMPAGNA